MGGRLISLRHGDRELLWRNPHRIDDALGLRTPLEQLPAEQDMASWWNFGGSKTWPAPQNDSDGLRGWGGPPDPVLDGGRYSFEAVTTHDGTDVRLTSAPDPRTGLQITREFRLAAARPDGFSQRITFGNHADRAVLWAPWEVCQVDARSGAGTVEVDLAQDGRLLDLGSYLGSPRAERSASGVRIPVQPVVAKWGFAGSATKISYTDSDVGLRLSFRVESDTTYPEGGCCAQLWMQYPTAEPIARLGGWHPDAMLLELEVLGPLRSLQPGEQTALEIDWAVTLPR